MGVVSLADSYNAAGVKDLAKGPRKFLAMALKLEGDGAHAAAEDMLQKAIAADVQYPIIVSRTYRPEVRMVHVGAYPAK